MYNYERQKNAPPELRDAYNYYFGAVFGWAENSNLVSVTAVDPTTVEFKLKAPQNNFLIAQAPLPQFGIQSPTALKAGDADNPDPSQEHVRAGPGDRPGRHAARSSSPSGSPTTTSRSRRTRTTGTRTASRTSTRSSTSRTPTRRPS